MKRISIKSILFAIASLKAEHIIGVSNSIIEEYIFKSIIRKKYIVVYNYIDKEKVLTLSANTKRSHDHYDLIYVGRLSKEKNPLDFIKIVQKVKNIKQDVNAIIIGDGPLRNDCEKLIRNLNLRSNITMLGKVKNPYVAMKQSSICIITSKYEGFSIVALEAIALGCAVLSSGVGGLKEICSDEQIYTDTSDCVNKIKSILRGATQHNANDISLLMNNKKYISQIKGLYG